MNKIYKILTLGLLIQIVLMTLSVGAETIPKEEWNKTFGNIYIIYSVKETTDKNYILLGRSMNNAWSINNDWLVKLDKRGNVLWSKNYVVGSYTPNDLLLTSDGGYIINNLKVGNLYVIKTDQLGNKQWDRTYNIPTSTTSITRTKDSGYAIIGGIGSSNSFLLKIDQYGTTQWNKDLGQSRLSSIQQTLDNGFILAGSIHLDTNGCQLIRTDQNGLIRWNKIVDDNLIVGCREVNSIQETIDGGFILAGKEFVLDQDGFGLLLIKFNQSGIEKWRNSTPNGWRGEPKSVQQTLDKGYIISNYRYYDERSFLEKIDQIGHYQWTKDIYGQSVIYYSIQTTDGSYIGTGSCLCLGDDHSDGFVVKLSQPAITVTSPNGGENWARGTIRTISWTSSGNPGTNVKIELLKGGILNSVISSSTPNDGSYSWTIPSTQILGSDYKVRITSTSNSIYTDTSNNNFMISSPTTITVTYPNGGEKLVRGTTKAIRWNYTGSPGANVKIDLLKGGILNRVITYSTPIGTGYYNWAILSTQTLGSDYKIRVTSTSNAAYTDMSNNNFIISNPYISVISPNGGENWARSSTRIISWTSAGSTGANVKIELFKSGVLNRVISSSTPNDGSFSWVVPSTQTLGIDYKIKITSTSNSAYNDLSNNYFRIS